MCTIQREELLPPDLGLNSICFQTLGYAFYHFGPDFELLLNSTETNNQSTRLQNALTCFW